MVYLNVLNRPKYFLKESINVLNRSNDPFKNGQIKCIEKVKRFPQEGSNDSNQMLRICLNMRYMTTSNELGAVTSEVSTFTNVCLYGLVIYACMVW